MQTVFFHYADRKFPLKDKTRIKQTITSIFQKEKVQLERLDYIFCSDEYLLEINRKFLNHDYYTDIITFDLSESRGVKGEIYISADRVKDNALSHSEKLTEERLRVIFHGALHLCGYKDKEKEDIVLMRKKEDFYLSYFHVKQSKIPKFSRST